MKITQLTVTEENLIEIVGKPNLYGITNGIFGYRIVPIKECEIGKLISGECGVIELEES